MHNIRRRCSLNPGCVRGSLNCQNQSFAAEKTSGSAPWRVFQHESGRYPREAGLSHDAVASRIMILGTWENSRQRAAP